MAKASRKGGGNQMMGMGFLIQVSHLGFSIGFKRSGQVRNVSPRARESLYISRGIYLTSENAC